jgi:hypothetical protein
LFSDWILDRYWGSRFTKIGGNEITCCTSYEDGQSKLKDIDMMLKKRGYEVKYKDIFSAPVQKTKNSES